jgi:hypothetical protein
MSADITFTPMGDEQSQGLTFTPLEDDQGGATLTFTPIDDDVVNRVRKGADSASAYEGGKLGQKALNGAASSLAETLTFAERLTGMGMFGDSADSLRNYVAENPAPTATWEQMRSGDASFLDYVGDLAATSFFDTATSVAGGGAGLLLKGAAKAATKSVVQRTARGTLKQRANQAAAFVKRNDRRIAGAAATAGSIAATAPTFAGRNLSRQIEERDLDELEDTDLGPAMVTALAQSSLDSILSRMFVMRFGPGGSQTAYKNLRSKAVRAVERTVREGVKGAGTEGLTEAAQQWLEIFQANPGKAIDMADPDVWREISEAFIGGAVLGGVLETGGSIASQALGQNPEADKVRSEIERQLGSPPPETEGAVAQKLLAGQELSEEERKLADEKGFVKVGPDGSLLPSPIARDVASRAAGYERLRTVVENGDIKPREKANIAMNSAVDAAGEQSRNVPADKRRMRRGRVPTALGTIAVDVPRGGVRSGRDADGREWTQPMDVAYGSLPGTTGADGDALDVYIGRNPTSERVFVINQTKPNGAFDEHKLMFGFDTAGEAISAYQRNFAPAKDRAIEVVPMTVSEAREWANSSPKTRLQREGMVTVGPRPDMLQAMEEEPEQYESLTPFPVPDAGVKPAQWHQTLVDQLRRPNMKVGRAPTGNYRTVNHTKEVGVVERQVQPFVRSNARPAGAEVAEERLGDALDRYQSVAKRLQERRRQIAYLPLEKAEQVRQEAIQEERTARKRYFREAHAAMKSIGLLPRNPTGGEYAVFSEAVNDAELEYQERLLGDMQPARDAVADIEGASYDVDTVTQVQAIIENELFLSPEEVATRAYLADNMAIFSGNSAEVAQSIFGDEAPRFSALVGALAPRRGSLQAAIIQAAEIMDYAARHPGRVKRDEFMRAYNAQSRTVIPADLWPEITAVMRASAPETFVHQRRESRAVAQLVGGLRSETDYDRAPVSERDRLVRAAGLVQAPSAGSVEVMAANEIMQEAARQLTEETGIQYTPESLANLIDEYIGELNGIRDIIASDEGNVLFDFEFGGADSIYSALTDPNARLLHYGKRVENYTRSSAPEASTLGAAEIGAASWGPESSADTARAEILQSLGEREEGSVTLLVPEGLLDRGDERNWDLTLADAGLIPESDAALLRERMEAAVNRIYADHNEKMAPLRERSYKLHEEKRALQKGAFAEYMIATRELQGENVKFEFPGEALDRMAYARKQGSMEARAAYAKAVRMWTDARRVTDQINEVDRERNKLRDAADDSIVRELSEALLELGYSLRSSDGGQLVRVVDAYDNMLQRLGPVEEGRPTRRDGTPFYTAQEVQKSVARWVNSNAAYSGLTVKVVSSRITASDPDVRAQPAGANAIVDLDKGNVWVFADRIKSEEHLADVLTHEIVGHYGLRSVLGGRYTEFMREFAKQFPNLIEERKQYYKVRAKNPDGSPMLGEDGKPVMVDRDFLDPLLAEEAIANMADRLLRGESLPKPQRSFMDRVANILRQIMGAFTGKRMSDQQVLRALVEARRFVNAPQSGHVFGGRRPPVYAAKAWVALGQRGRPSRASKQYWVQELNRQASAGNLTRDGHRLLRRWVENQSGQVDQYKLLEFIERAAHFAKATDSEPPIMLASIEETWVPEEDEENLRWQDKFTVFEMAPLEDDAGMSEEEQSDLAFRVQSAIGPDDFNDLDVALNRLRQLQYILQSEPYRADELGPKIRWEQLRYDEIMEKMHAAPIDGEPLPTSPRVINAALTYYRNTALDYPTFERMEREGGRVKIERTGSFTTAYNKIVGSPKDRATRIAQILSPLANDPQEIAGFAVVGSDGSMRGFYELHRGSMDRVEWDARLAGVVARDPEATRVYMIHQHPDGDGRHSEGDYGALEAMESLFANSGIQFEGSVVVAADGGSFARPGAAVGEYESLPVRYWGDNDFDAQVPRYRRMYRFAQNVTRNYTLDSIPPTAPLVHRERMAEAYLQGQSGLLLMDRGKIVAALPMSPEEMVRPNVSDKRQGIIPVLGAVERSAASEFMPVIDADEIGMPEAKEALLGMSLFLESIGMSRIPGLIRSESMAYSQPEPDYAAFDDYEDAVASNAPRNILQSMEHSEEELDQLVKKLGMRRATPEERQAAKPVPRFPQPQQKFDAKVRPEVPVHGESLGVVMVPLSRFARKPYYGFRVNEEAPENPYSYGFGTLELDGRVHASSRWSRLQMAHAVGQAGIEGVAELPMWLHIQADVAAALLGKSVDRFGAINEEGRENFERWFMGSQVVFPDGTPRPMYHSTNVGKDFDQFRIAEDDIGIHVGTALAAAARFGQLSRYEDDFYTPGRTYRVYVSMKNPLRMRDESGWEPKDVLHLIGGKEADSFPDSTEEERQRLLDAAMSVATPEKMRQPRKLVHEVLRAAGYDGIVYQNDYEGGGDSYIVFEPSQLKSAMANTGEYDPDRPSILRSVGAEDDPLTPTPTPATWEMYADNMSDRVIYNLQDQFVDLSRVQEQIEKSGAEIGDDSNPRLRQTLYSGVVRARVDKYRKEFVEPLLKAVRESDYTYDDLEEYLYARHAPEANEQMAKVNKSNELEKERRRVIKQLVKKERAAQEAARQRYSRVMAAERARHAQTVRGMKRETDLLIRFGDKNARQAAAMHRTMRDQVAGIRRRYKQLEGAVKRKLSNREIHDQLILERNLHRQRLSLLRQRHRNSPKMLEKKITEAEQRHQLRIAAIEQNRVDTNWDLFVEREREEGLYLADKLERAQLPLKVEMSTEEKQAIRDAGAERVAREIRRHETRIAKLRDQSAIEKVAISMEGRRQRQATDTKYARAQDQYLHMNNLFGLSGMTDEEARLVIERMSSKGDIKQLEAMAERVYAANRAHEDRLVEEGLLDKEVVDSWRAAYKFYVPLKGYADGAVQTLMPAHGRGYDTGSKMFKRRTGRRTRAGNIIGNLVAQQQAAMVMAEKNVVGKSLLNLAKENPNPKFWMVNSERTVPVIDPSTGLRTERPAPPRDNEFHVRVDGKIETITFREDNAQAMRLVESLKNLSAQEAGVIVNGLSAVNRHLAMVNTGLNPEFMLTNFFRDLQSAYINMSATEADRVRGKALKEVWKARNGVREWQQEKDTEYARWFEDFRNNGAQTGWLEHYRDVEALEKELIKQVERNPSDASMLRSLVGLKDYVENQNIAFENAIRLSTYKNLVESGAGKAQAAKVARELTVDFNRRGNWSVVAGALYLFYNASIQGSAVIAKTLMRSRKARALLGTAMAGHLALDIANRIIGGEDDDGENRYDKIPDHVKERNLIVMLPKPPNADPNKDYALRFPMPYGYNVAAVMAQALGGGISQAMGVKDDWDILEESSKVMTAALNSFNPIGSSATLAQTVSPTLTQPLVQIGENVAWHGGDLRPPADPYRVGDEPESQRYFRSTPSFYVTVAEELNELPRQFGFLPQWMRDIGGTRAQPSRIGFMDQSPEVLELWVDFVTGGVGRTAMSLLSNAKDIYEGDFDPADTTMLRKFINVTDEDAVIARFWDIVEDVDTAEAEITTNRERRRLARNEKEAEEAVEAMREAREKYKVELGMGKTTESYRKRLSELRKRMDALEARGADDDEIEALEDRRTEVMRRMIRLYNQRKNPKPSQSNMESAVRGQGPSGAADDAAAMGYPSTAALLRSLSDEGVA